MEGPTRVVSDVFPVFISTGEWYGTVRRFQVWFSLSTVVREKVDDGYEVGVPSDQQRGTQEITHFWLLLLFEKRVCGFLSPEHSTVVRGLVGVMSVLGFFDTGK